MVWVGSGPDVDLPQGCACGAHGSSEKGSYEGYYEGPIPDADLRRPAAGQA